MCGQISQRLRWTNGILAHPLPRPQMLPAKVTASAISAAYLARHTTLPGSN
jgi:hypothetical protein